MNLTTETTRQAYDIVQRGTSIAELAEAWDISTRALYTAFQRHGLRLESGLSPAEHVAMQQQSGTPPDVYAARAGINVKSLRVYAAQNHQQLALRLHTEAKQWWTEKLEALDPAQLQLFCIREDLPVALVASWYHRINCPRVTLLWGFNELRVLQDDMFDDVTRFHNHHAGTHVLGRGKSVAHVDIRVATEAFRHSCVYQYQQC